MKRWLMLMIVAAWGANATAQGYYWQSAGKEKKIKNLSLEAGLGLRMYFGDIQQKGALYNKVKFTYGAGVRYQWRPHVGFALQGGGRGYAGHAEHGAYPDAIDDMTGKLWEGQLMVQYSWLKWEDFTRRAFTERDPVTKINLFVGAGFGGSLYNASYTSRTYKTRVVTDSLGRDSTIAIPVDRSGSSGGFGIYVPTVFGFRYRLRPEWSLGFEMQRHFYITKTVDAYSSKKFDGMGTFTVRLSYTFGQVKKKGEAKVKRKS